MAPAGGNPIAARGLGKSFGALPILRAIDLEVARGATVALIGSNGAGKSTLLKLLAGVMRPSRGSLELFGVGCYPERSTPNLLSRIGYLGHDPLVYRDLSARENLEFFARLYDPKGNADTGPPGARAARAAAALERAGLAATADRPAHALSRGMLQRLALARATLHRPELLLLDEPFSGLDPAGSAHLEAELAEARAAGRTTVLVTHDLALVARLADRAVLLARGRVALDLAPVPPADELAAVYRRTSGESLDVGDRA